MAGDRAELADVVAVLAQVRERAWRLCREAAAVDPRTAAEVPGDDDLARLHRALSQAAVRCAQAAQAVVLAEADGPGTPPEAARRAAEQAGALLAAVDQRGDET